MIGRALDECDRLEIFPLEQTMLFGCGFDGKNSDLLPINGL